MGLYHATEKNRNFNNVALEDYRKTPYWNEVGFLKCGLKVLVVRHRKKYFVSNRLNLDPKELRMIYRKRQLIENFFAYLKSHLSLERCQAGNKRTMTLVEVQKTEAQKNHITLCITAFLVLEKERSRKKSTWLQAKQEYIFRGRRAVIPALNRLRKIA